MSEPPAFLMSYEPDGRQRVIDNRHAVLRWDLERRHVAPDIIERVIRLNPTEAIGGGRRLRGLHYKPGNWYGFMRGLVSKGAIIRLGGRAIWDRIPREAWVKDGRRVWVSYRDADAAATRQPQP